MATEPNINNIIVQQVVDAANLHAEFAKRDEANGDAMSAEKEWGFSRGVWYALKALNYNVEIDTDGNLKFTPVE